MQEETQRELPVPVPQSTPAAALEKLLPSYQRHFDITRDCELLGRRLPAKAHFYSRGEKYVLTKRAKLWAVECNEHVLFFTPQRLSLSELQDILTLLDEAEQELVQPHEEHMYTYLSAVIIADSAEEEAVSALRRYKHRKYYKFSLHGYSQARLGLVDLSSNAVHTNRDGKEMRKALGKITV